MPSPREELLHHIDDVKSWCLQRSGDPHLADDVAQDTVLAALRRWDDLRDRDRLRGWLFKIAQRRLADAARERRNLPLTEEPLAREPAEADVEKIKLARRALRVLPAYLRRPVRLYYMQGKPLREVARVLRMSPNAVKARLYRARRLMRREAAR